MTHFEWIGRITMMPLAQPGAPHGIRVNNPTAGDLNPGAAPIGAPFDRITVDNNGVGPPLVSPTTTATKPIQGQLPEDTMGEMGAKPNGTIVLSNPAAVDAQDGGATNFGSDQTGHAPYGNVRVRTF